MIRKHSRSLLFSRSLPLTFFSFLLLVIFLGSLLSSLRAAEPQVFHLPSGLTLVVEEDHKLPLASLQVWCHTGSANEGECLGGGLSHILEHMLFQGTENYAPEEIFKQVNSYGGEMNAGTFTYFTNYYMNLPKNGVDEGIKMLSEMTQHATLPNDQYAREHGVIRRELAMRNDSPSTFLFDRIFLPSFFEGTPYSKSAGGELLTFEKMSRQNALDYYHQRYFPSNLCFVVVGDVDAQAIYQQVMKLFPFVPSQNLGSEGDTKKQEPSSLLAPLGKKVIRATYPTQESQLLMAWHLPGTTAPEGPAVDLLATILGGGESSLLYQNLYQKKALVHTISCDTMTIDPEPDAGNLIVFALMDPKKREKAEHEILATLATFVKQGVSQDELERAKNQLLLDHYQSEELSFNRASNYGEGWATAHNPLFQKEYFEKLQKVTVEEINHLTKMYLNDDHLLLVSLDPGNLPKWFQKEKKEEEKNIASAPSSDTKEENSSATKANDNLGANSENPLASAVDQREAQEGKKKLPPSLKNYTPKSITLKNGLRLIVCEDHSIPIVTMQAAFRGGVLAEGEDSWGATELMASTVTKGTKKHSGKEIADIIEQSGGSLTAAGTSDSFLVSEEILSSYLKEGGALFQEVLTDATFPQEEVKKAKGTQLAALAMVQDDPVSQGKLFLNEKLFGTHPYAHATLGDQESLSGQNSESLQQFYQKICVAKNGVILLSGDITFEKAKKLFAPLEEKMPSGEMAWQHVEEPKTLSAPLHEKITTDKEQAILLQGFLGVPQDNPDYFALSVLGRALSNPSGPVFRQIRQEKGLAYYAYGANTSYSRGGEFLFYLGCDPQKATEAKKALDEVIVQIVQNGLSQEDFEAAQQQLLVNKLREQESATQCGQSLLFHELFGLGANYDQKWDQKIRSLTLEEVNLVAKKYLDTPNLVEVIVEKK